jgi:type IV pilus assembly protein PilY1
MKILPNSIHNTSYRNVSNWSVKLLSTVIMGCMATSAGHTSDLEIYQGAIGGNASILMMLDNSGSMDSRSIAADYPGQECRNPKTDQKSQRLYDDSDNAISGNAGLKKYNVTYCENSSGTYYDRMSRLKMALIPLFARPKDQEEGFGPDADISKYNVGLGSFFYSADAGGGKIVSPVKDLTLDNRKKLIDKIIELQPTTNTPMANAYAEAGAYMLGTSTQSTETETVYEEVGYLEHRSNNNQKYYLYRCDRVRSSTYSYNDDTYSDCRSDSYVYVQGNTKNRNEINVGLLGNYQKTIIYNTGNGTETVYYRAKTRVAGANPASGFSRSDDTTKKQPDKLTYQSPLPDKPNQCDGYGIYFLTDGEPNSSFSESNTRGLMNSSLEGGISSIGGSCESLSAPTPMITSSGTEFEDDTYYGKPAWECIGEYSTKLYDKGNAKKALIATATVGFGKVFAGLTDKTTKAIRRPSGKVETVDVYQCDIPGVNKDAQNLCKLGEKGYGHGQGGFYYAANSKDIAKSLKTFIEETANTEIDPISAGTMSVPLDSLGGLKSRKFAYLPILEPVPGSQRLWNGNLKKYNVVNGTLKGDDGNFVFEDNTGLFAKNTHDIWNTIRNSNRPDAFIPDGGLPQVGGAYQQIFENANAPIVGDRNVFVDTGNSLTNLKVTDQKPVNFASLTDGTENNNDKKLALLKFMGYSVTDTVTDGTALSEPQNKDLKNVGGVLHSIPQLITQSVEVDASGQFDTSTRKDYIIYGSMDGALHMLDDSTGQETFTFVPKQILDLQPDALASNGNGTAVDGSYPYGVDAPWLTYVAYTTKSKTEGEGEEAKTTYSYEAAQSFALGGLRMGGSMYYALDVTDVNKPSMIYSVGSNYSNRQKGLSTDVSGIKNGAAAIVNVATATPEQKAYARMGQTWGKPTLGYVKSGGERVMVSFLPGGYDACYEDPQFKLGNSTNSESCTDKSKAQGNAVYMVQMGEVEDATDGTGETAVSNGEEIVDTSDGNGDLLWWASNQGSSANSTSRSTSLQYSRDDDLKHSIVTQVRAIDRNYDGLTDHIYFADLGGQVWRADINNNKDTDTFKVDRVVKVLDVSDQAKGNDAPPRIYERPLITFFNGKYGYNDVADNTGTYSGVQAMITVGTGDRSNPVSAERETPDALYTVIDKDVSRRDLFDYDSDAASTISLRTPVIEVGDPDGSTSNRLQQLMFTDADRGDTGIRQNMISNAIQGWYMPFTYWDDAAVSTSKYKLKMFNEPDAIAGVLISSTYNPDEGQDIQACSAGVKGSTQRERTCLPFGSCSEDVVTPRSTFIAGSGIVDNIISQYNDTAVFSSLVNRCEGDACKPDLICPDGNCGNYDDIFNECVGPSCGVESGISTDKRLNPLGWLEH